MDKLKKMFKKDDESDLAGQQASTPSQRPTGSSQPSAPSAGGSAGTANTVVLHTNVGDITIKLFSDQTPKVSSLHYPSTPMLR